MTCKIVQDRLSALRRARTASEAALALDKPLVREAVAEVNEALSGMASALETRWMDILADLSDVIATATGLTNTVNMLNNTHGRYGVSPGLHASLGTLADIRLPTSIRLGGTGGLDTLAGDRIRPAPAPAVLSDAMPVLTRVVRMAEAVERQRDLIVRGAKVPEMAPTQAQGFGMVMRSR